MSGIITEWLNLLIRWFHIVVGIGWIGTSFFFIWLDAHLTPKAGAARGSVGEIWLFHSGGFYEVEKKLVVPTEVLPSLHWFKWEAYLTWISGFLLLIVVYYLGGGVFLIDPGQSSIGLPVAVLIGLGTLGLGWLVYDFLWRSPLGRNPPLATAISFLLLAAIAFGLSRVFSGRAAYMHVGALLGTIMAANVWRVIQPAQRQMYRINLSGGEPDVALSKQAKLRSTHNNYMTLPVIFVMVSNHFPSTYGNAYNWIVLLVLFLAGAGRASLSQRPRPRSQGRRLGAGACRRLLHRPHRLHRLAGLSARHRRRFRRRRARGVRRGAADYRRALHRLPFGEADRRCRHRGAQRRHLRHAGADQGLRRQDPCARGRYRHHAARQQDQHVRGRARRHRPLDRRGGAA